MARVNFTARRTTGPPLRQVAKPPSDEEFSESEDGESVHDESEDEIEKLHMEDNPVVSTPADINAGLQDILARPLEFHGTFAASLSYADAPNPCLSVEDVGVVGLPLGSLYAHAIKESYSHSTSLIPVSMSGSDVAFENTEVWTAFVKKAALAICDTLGLKLSSECQPEFMVLFLYWRNTRVAGTSYADEYGEDGFISLFIDLPSAYTGGALSISYDGLTQRFDTSATSASQTIVTGCLYAARHSMARIKDGFRFVLEYRIPAIVQTTTKLNRVPVRDLRRILRLWKHMPANSAPQKIIFLLDRRRKDQDKELRLLLGNDARKVGLLRTVGKGFHLATADLAYVEKGVGVQPDSVDPCTAGKVEMKEVLETALSLETLVELDRPGKVHRETLDVDASTELISADLASVFHSEAPAYQKYDPSASMPLTRVYRKAALVLWPHRNHVDIVFGARALAVACKKIQRSWTRTTGVDMAVECALAHARPEDCADIISTVCDGARSWGDPELWLRAVSVCDAERAISNLEPRNALCAVSSFGLDKIRDCLERTLERDPNISNGLRFLSTLDEMPARLYKDPTSQALKEWISGQRVKLLRTLNVTEQGHDGAQIIVTSAIAAGDVGILETTVLDYLNTLSDPALLIEFASKVHTRVPRLAKPDVARLTKNALVRAILSADLVNTEKPSESVRLAESLVKTSKEVEHEDLIMTVAACITNFDHAGDAVTVWHIVKTILLPFINTLQGFSFTESATMSLSTLCKSTVRLYLNHTSAFPKDFALEDMGPLLQAVALTSEHRALLTNITTTLMNFGSQTQTEVLPTLLDELPTRLAAVWHDSESLALSLAMKYVASLDILIPGDPPSLKIDEILHALERGVRIDAPQSCALLIERVLGQKQPGLKASIRALLVRLVPHFRKLLLIHKREHMPPYTALYRTLVVYWIDKQMGSRPQFDHLTALLQNVQAHNTCTVPSCECVHAFLKSSDRMATHRQSTLDPPSRAHIESVLRTYTGVGVTYDETDQALVITKHGIILGPSCWSLDQEDGAKMVKALSVSPKELQAILGADYARIVSALGLPMPALTSGTPRTFPTTPATYPTALGGSSKGRRKSRLAKAQTQEGRAAVASTSSLASVPIPTQTAGGVKRPSYDPATSGGLYFGPNGGQDAKRRKMT